MKTLKLPVIYTYKRGSQSAKALATELGRRFHLKRGPAKRVVAEGNPHIEPRYVVVTWGSGASPVQWQPMNEFTLNSQEAVKKAANKLLSFQAFEEAGVSHPEWTTSIDEANGWDTVICRMVLNGHSGEGIVIAVPGEALPDAPLYVKYKKKKHEYRVHVFLGEVIDVQQKKRERDVERDEEAQMVRNRANGWVFAREDVFVPQTLHSVALSAVAALGLDFGAVDIIYNQKENKCYALEVNTAPGLEGETIKKYGEAIEHYVRDL